MSPFLWQGIHRLQLLQPGPGSSDDSISNLMDKIFATSIENLATLALSPLSKNCECPIPTGSPCLTGQVSFDRRYHIRLRIFQRSNCGRTCGQTYNPGKFSCLSLPSPDFILQRLHIERAVLRKKGERGCDTRKPKKLDRGWRDRRSNGGM